MGSEKEQSLTMHGLKSAAGFIQTKVADRLTTRYVPHITFVLDEGVKKSVEIARLIREEKEQLAIDHAAAGVADPDAADDASEDDEEDEHPEKPAEQSGPAADGPTDRPD
jgi:ribosome-binding factor A